MSDPVFNRDCHYIHMLALQRMCPSDARMNACRVFQLVKYVFKTSQSFSSCSARAIKFGKGVYMTNSPQTLLAAQEVIVYNGNQVVGRGQINSDGKWAVNLDKPEAELYQLRAEVGTQVSEEWTLRVAAPGSEFTDFQNGTLNGWTAVNTHGWRYEIVPGADRYLKCIFPSADWPGDFLIKYISIPPGRYEFHARAKTDYKEVTLAVGFYDGHTPVNQYDFKLKSNTDDKWESIAVEVEVRPSTRNIYLQVLSPRPNSAGIISFDDLLLTRMIS